MEIFTIGYLVETLAVAFALIYWAVIAIFRPSIFKDKKTLRRASYIFLSAIALILFVNVYSHLTFNKDVTFVNSGGSIAVGRDLNVSPSDLGHYCNNQNTINQSIQCGVANQE